MATATLVNRLDIPDSDRHPKALVTAVALSLALHLGVAGWLSYAAWSEPEKSPRAFVVDVVELPKPPKPKAPEPTPPAAMPPLALPPPPLPQLTEAPIADKSAPPPHDSPVKAPPRDRAGTSRDRGRTLVAHAETSLPATTKSPKAKPVTHGERDVTPGTVGGKTTEVASQTVQDFILMQIARVWIIDLQSPRFRDMGVQWQFTLLPNGMLASPFGKNDPLDLQSMLDPHTYELMQQPTEQGQTFRTAVVTFLQAVREAQPFRVPPNEKSYKDRLLPLRFRFGDLVQSPTEGGR